MGTEFPVLWLAFISHGGSDLLRGRNNWLTLLRCPGEKLAKLNK